MSRAGRVATLVCLAAGVGTLLTAARSRRSKPVRGKPVRGKPVRVVVVGAGFGGLQAALHLAGKPVVELCVIDARGQHLFQPLLYQVATAALMPADIVSPVASILQGTPNLRIVAGTVTGVDTVDRRVLTDDASVPYDELIVATGNRPSYFGHPGWAAAAPGLKTLDDALGLRRRILDAFEQAATATGQDRERWLTFVLIGGGPTGVEMAGSLAELAPGALGGAGAADLRARIVVIEAGDHLLSGFAPPLADYAAQALRGMGVELRTGTRVTGIEPGRVHLHDTTLEANTVIWTAGNEATPVANWLGVHAGHGGRVAVDPALQVPGRPGIAVIGDAALVNGRNGKPLPGVAPVAKQQGAFAARAVLRRMRGRDPGRFTYRDYGTLATIGRNKGVAEFGRVRLTGFVAWLTWAVAHIFFLIGFRNRLLVSAQWAFSYVTHRRPALESIERHGAARTSEDRAQPGLAPAARV